MSDTYRDLHGDAYREWKDEKATEYMENQRAAFMAGFEAAAKEGEQFRLLREWLTERRDEAKERHDETGDIDDFAQYHAFVEVLVKLSEMGCDPTENDHE